MATLKTISPSFDSIDQYIKSRSSFWALSTQVTARAKLRKLFRMQIVQPFRLLQELKEEGKAPYTIQVYFEILKGFEKFCNRGKSQTEEFMKKHRGLFRNAYQDKVYRLSMEEYQGILKEAEAKHLGLYNMCLLMGGAGLRLTEALKANWKDLSADGSLRVEGKGGKIRFVPIPIDQFRKEGFDAHGRIVGVSPPFRRFFSGKTFTAHDLRAFFATSIANSVSPYELMDLLGHSDFNTTLKYVRRNPKVIREKLHGHYRTIQGAIRSDDRSNQIESKSG